jgi:hypothetical protein
MSERDWARGGLDDATFERLAHELTGAELQSALLPVLRERARGRSPAQVLEQFARDGFCRPGSVDLRESMAVDAQLLAAAADFEAIELSPLAPLATTSVFGRSDQNRVVSALRGTEVVSDPTNVLALHSALQLRVAPDRSFHYATSQRVVRAQPVPKRPGHSQHFRLFVLASAGVEQREHGFSSSALGKQIRALLDGLSRLESLGYGFGERRVELLTTPKHERLALRLREELDVAVSIGTLEHGYYSGGFRFRLWATPPSGVELPIADGGSFDWLARLTSNRRAVFIASGLGVQLIPLAFRELR